MPHPKQTDYHVIEISSDSSDTEDGRPHRSNNDDSSGHCDLTRMAMDIRHKRQMLVDYYYSIYSSSSSSGGGDRDDDDDMDAPGDFEWDPEEQLEVLVCRRFSGSGGGDDDSGSEMIEFRGWTRGDGGGSSGDNTSMMSGHYDADVDHDDADDGGEAATAAAAEEDESIGVVVAGGEGVLACEDQSGKLNGSSDNGSNARDDIGDCNPTKPKLLLHVAWETCSESSCSSSSSSSGSSDNEIHNNSSSTGRGRRLGSLKYKVQRKKKVVRIIDDSDDNYTGLQSMR